VRPKRAYFSVFPKGLTKQLEIGLRPHDLLSKCIPILIGRSSPMLYAFEIPIQGVAPTSIGALRNPVQPRLEFK
jgi:hypothetical protein